MAKKTLGRDLGDLLARARPARIVATVTPVSGLSPATGPSAHERSDASANPLPDPVPGNPASTMPKLASPPATPVLVGPAVGSENTPRRRPDFLRPPSQPAGQAATADHPDGDSSVPRRYPAFYLLIGLDVVLVLGALVAVLGGFFEPDRTLPGAIGAVALGACLSILAVLLPRPRPAPAGSRVRVHLTRA